MPLPAVVGAALSAAGASEATALAAEAATAAGLKVIGSAAGLAQKALAACRQELADFSRGVGVATLGLTAAATAVQVAGREIAGAVAKFSPGAVTRFTLASDNLTASIGRLLLPVLERLTPVVQTVADAFASLRPEGNQLVAAATAAGAAMGVLAAGIAAAGAAVIVAFGGIPLLVGAVVGAVAGGMAGLAFVLKDTAEVTRIARTAAGELVRVLNVMGAAAKVLLPLLEPAANAFGRLAKAVADQFVRAVLVAAPALEQVGGVVVRVFDALADAMGPLQPVFDKVAGVATRLGATLAEWFGAKVEVLAGLLADLAPGLESLVESVDELLGSGFELISEVFDAVGQAVMDLTGGTDGLNEALEGVAGAVRFVAREVLPLLTFGLKMTVTVFSALLDVVQALTSPARTVVQALAGLFSKDDFDRESVPEDRYSRSFKPGAAEGMAVRGVSSGDQMSAIRRAQEAAFGSGQRPEVQTAKGVTSMAETLKGIKDGVERLPENLALKLATFIANNAPPGSSTAANFAAGAVPGGPWLQRQLIASITG